MRHLDPGNPSLYLAAFLVSLDGVTGENMRNFSFLIQQHVNDKVEPGHFGLFYHILVYRVSPEDPGPGTGMLYHLIAVVFISRPCAEDAGGDAFPAAGKAGEKVRLNKSGTEAKIRCHNPGIYVHGGAPGGGADVDRPVDIVVYDIIVRHDIFTQFFNQLMSVQGWVQPEGNDNRDVLARYSGFQLVQYRGEQPVIGARPGVIGNQDHDFVIFLDAVKQGGALYRGSQAAGDGFSLIRKASDIRHLYNAGQVAGRYPGL